MSTFYYFAFGSNLLKERLQLANPSASFISTAKLQGHAIAFNSIGKDPRSSRWKGGVATIVEHLEQEVWGCVWRLDAEHRESLDKQELYYRVKDVDVVAPDNAKFTCITYYLPGHYFDLKEFDHRPSPMYLDVIIRGARQNRLPDTYLQALETIEHNGHLDNELDIYVSILKLLPDENQSVLSTIEIDDPNHHASVLDHKAAVSLNEEYDNHWINVYITVD
ncbi:GGCT-like protein [Mya arenaria]|uniref:gamma-glutamylcyclotransferase n=1 Tax=Mya arenaria TaxID=6604 RepID=A0ABY7EWQ2_MYAAR|nr:gamma-glutamylcyclotransferase-like [Mya arenaria]WAR13131.1 GGCT-like protein [Mya arenaria]